MKYVLGPDAEPPLLRFARARTLLAFDFDGTLAPIVADRGAAAMAASTSALLARACALYPCAVISGRGRADVLGRLAGVSVRQVVGNHGVEPSDRLGDFEAEMVWVQDELERRLGPVPGVEIEPKGASLAVHYRGASNPDDAGRAVRSAVAALSRPVRVVPGELVVNLVPRQAPHKGDALLRIMQEEALERAVYVGDDVTDEDVFALDLPGRLLAVRVGRSSSSAAAYFLPDQGEVDGLLARLVELRSGA